MVLNGGTAEGLSNSVQANLTAELAGANGTFPGMLTGCQMAAWFPLHLSSVRGNLISTHFQPSHAVK